MGAALRGPVEYWAFLRAAASNWGVSWGDLRSNTLLAVSFYKAALLSVFHLRLLRLLNLHAIEPSTLFA